MRSTNTPKAQTAARRIWEAFLVARAYQARQLLKNHNGGASAFDPFA